MMLNEPHFIKHDVSPQNSHLMQVLRFNEEMLYENQAGVLTGPQRRYLRRRFMDHGYDLVLPFIAMLCLVAFDVFGYQGVCGSAFGFCVLVFGCIITFEGQFKVGRDLKNDRVECIKGAIYISRAEAEFYGASSIYPYTIHALGSLHFFRVTRQVAAAFIEKDVYTLYYVPSSQILLSAEHLPEESPRRTLPEFRGTRRERRENRERQENKQKHG